MEDLLFYVEVMSIFCVEISIRGIIFVSVCWVFFYYFYLFFLEFCFINYCDFFIMMILLDREGVESNDFEISSDVDEYLEEINLVRGS